MDAGEVRMTKILRLIRTSRFGIHDISRTALDPINALPRFNMPLELGLFLGASHFGNASQRSKQTLVAPSNSLSPALQSAKVKGLHP